MRIAVIVRNVIVLACIFYSCPNLDTVRIWDSKTKILVPIYPGIEGSGNRDYPWESHEE